MKTILLTLASVALVSSIACADGDKQTAAEQTTQSGAAQQHTPKASFDQHDKNKDGKISKDEAATNMALTDSWSEIDYNEDGSVDITEFARFEPTPKAEGAASTKPSAAESNASSTDMKDKSESHPGPSEK